MKTYIITLLTTVLLSELSGQLLDTASPIDFDRNPALSKTGSGYLLKGSSLKLNVSTHIEGVALRFGGDIGASVWIQYIFKGDSLSEKYPAKLFDEPGSDRFIASVLQKSQSEVIRIRYTAEANEPLNLISGGIYTDHDNEEILNDKNNPMIPKKLSVEKPKIISRAEWGLSLIHI